jgi:hypothetical protein
MKRVATKTRTTGLAVSRRAVGVGSFVSPHQICKPYVTSAQKLLVPADATVALSQDALSLLVRRAIDKPIVAQSSGSWGPFVAGYDVNLNVAGGSITLIDLGPQIRLDGVVVWGVVNLTLGLDLARILPRVCIPPDRVCIPTPWGDVCTPQVCVSWPTISVTIPVPIPQVGLSANFQVAAQRDGDNWDVILKVFPFSILFDLSPTVNQIADAVKNVVHDTLGRIPLIGGLIEGLVDAVINALRSILVAVLGAITAFMKQLIILIDLFSPTIPFTVTQIPVRQRLLATGAPGDREVDLNVATLSPSVASQELVIAATFA